MRIVVLLTLAVVNIVTGSSAQTKGYGDWPDDYPGYPDMKERRVLVLTNTCRMAPEEYRDTYIGDYQILLPANYPPVDPLYWHIDLNRSSRFHSKDMADNHGLSHTSSDGTAWDDRIRSFYTKSGYFAENIATGGKDAFSTMRQWIMDGDPPAPDGSGDGHRKSIMGAKYNELGSGYAYGTQQWYHFWTQDFSTGTPDFSTPITAGAHFIMDTDSILFMVTYTDPNGQAPKKASLVIDSMTLDLSLFMGSDAKGTYTLSLPTADDCRYYCFQFTDSDGNFHRHPAGGMLVTIGEGSCEEQYQDPVNVSIGKQPAHNKTPLRVTVTRFMSSEILLKAPDMRWVPVASTLVNCKGELLARCTWDGVFMRLCPVQSLANGTYFLVHHFVGQVKVVVKVSLVD